MLLVVGGFSSSSSCARCVCDPSESSRQDFPILNKVMSNVDSLDVSFSWQEKLMMMNTTRQTWALPLSSSSRLTKWSRLPDMLRPRNNFHLVHLRSRFDFHLTSRFFHLVHLRSRFDFHLRSRFFHLISRFFFTWFTWDPGLIFT